MSVDSQILRLNKDIDSCQSTLENLMRKRMESKESNCPNCKSTPTPINPPKEKTEKPDNRPIFLPAGSLKSHHKVAQAQNKVLSKEKFSTDKAVVEVEIKCSSKKDSSPIRKPTQEKTKKNDIREKTSWSNILKSQNDATSSNSKVHEDKFVQCSDPQRIPSNAFSSFNPTRTLMFLIAEFKSKVKKTNNEELLELLHDMDSTLQRMISQKCCHDSEESKVESKVPDNSALQKLEKSYAKLERTFIKLEATCSALRDEKAKMKKQLEDSNQKLDLALDRETQMSIRMSETMSHVATLRRQKESDEKIITELQQKITELQNENKAVISLREMQNKLNLRLTEILNENAKVNGEKQLLLIEREKLQALISYKDRELTKLRNNIATLGTIVSKELVSVKGRPILESDDVSSVLSTTIDNGDTLREEGIICSSPNSSEISSSPQPYSSWQGISAIEEQTPVKNRKKRSERQKPVREEEVKALKSRSPHTLPLKQNPTNTSEPLEAMQDLRKELGVFFNEMAKKVTTKGGGDQKSLTSAWSELNSTDASERSCLAASILSDASLP